MSSVKIWNSFAFVGNDIETEKEGKGGGGGSTCVRTMPVNYDAGSGDRH